MRQKIFANCGLVLFSIFMALALASAASAASENSQEGPPAATSAEMTSRLPSGTLAILPFVKGEYTENFRTGSSPLICPVDQVCVDLREGDQTLFFMEKIDQELHRILKKRLGANLIPLAESKAQYQAYQVDPLKDTTLSRALVIGGKLKSAYVLVPILWDYADRLGTAYSVEKPASVSISLYLVSVDLEKRVWQDSFDRTQQSLTENLLKIKEFFKLGGHWATAAELAQVGLQTMLEDFPLSAN